MSPCPAHCHCPLSYLSGSRIFHCYICCFSFWPCLPGRALFAGLLFPVENKLLACKHSVQTQPPRAHTQHGHCPPDLINPGPGIKGQETAAAPPSLLNHLTCSVLSLLTEALPKSHEKGSPLNFKFPSPAGSWSKPGFPPRLSGVAQC